MKTFYVMQGGALEEYLKESQSSGKGRGSYGEGKTNCEVVCEKPAAEPNPNCECEEPVTPIDGGIGISLVLGITLGIMTLLRLKNLKKG